MNLYLYRDKDTFFHRLDPRTKIFLLLTIFIIATMQEALYGSIIIMLLVLLHGFISKSFENIGRIWFILVLIFVFSTIVWTLSLDGRTYLFTGIALEPILFGMATGIKLDAMIISGIIFLTTTTNEDISLALVLLKIPYRLTFAFITALRLVPTFVGTAFTVVNAQKSRGVEIDKGNILKRVKKYIPLLGPILLLTLRYTVQLSMALESKCFGHSKKRTFYNGCKFCFSDYVSHLIFLMITILCIFLKMKGYFKLQGLLM